MKAADPIIAFGSSPHARVRPLPLSAVRLGDGFWSARQRAIHENGLWHGLEQLRKTGSVEAFDIAAGLSSAEARGLVYRDSDLYKWLEAASYALGSRACEELRPDVDSIIEKIEGTQDSDGYLNTWFVGERKKDRFTNLESDHEIYCAGHLIQAAIAHHRATGQRRLLIVAERLASHLYEQFGPDGRFATGGHPCAEMALAELYRETGNRRWLTLSQRFLDARGQDPPVLGGKEYLLDHLPVREQRAAAGHAVRALYLYAGAADIYLETGEDTLLDSLTTLWEDVQTGKTYITGGVGARHEGEAFGERYELPNARAYAETCAATASVMWNWRMFAITADAKYIDVIENALYNSFLSGVSLDGTRYFYVNPLECDASHERRPWFDCACCPPNIYRTICSVHGLFFATDDDGVFVNLYDNVQLRHSEFALRMTTRYPWDGDVSLEVQSEGEFELRLRIPRWCGAAVVETPEGRREAQPGAFHRVRRAWRNGDRVLLRMQMPALRVAANPRIRENRNAAAFIRGPIVYCFESAGNPGVPVRDACVNAGAHVAHDWRPDLLSGVEALTTEGRVPRSCFSAQSAYFGPEQAVESDRAVRLTAVPYFARANREPGEMIVWMPIAEK
ncbi:MAG: glycoside hydrolase family 127 protein [Armatimonadetes bacterium]|nr:glycoside hydrolase family 127 protein [Armatimonadota bacterium]